MPFPFKCLPYGFRQRLRELSNPAEAYNLQIAVGNQLLGLQPLVPAVDKHWMRLTDTNGVATVQWPSENGFVNTTNFDNVPLVDPVTKKIVFNISAGVYIDNVRDDFFDNPNFTNVYINKGRDLSITTNELNLSFIKAFAARIQNVRNLGISTSKSTVPIGQLFSLFPDVEKAELTFANERWVQELLLLKRQNLSLSFVIRRLDQFDSVLSFRAGEMELLLKNECTVAIKYEKMESTFDAEKKIYKLVQNSNFVVNVDHTSFSVDHTFFRQQKQKTISFALKK